MIWLLLLSLQAVANPCPKIYPTNKNENVLCELTSATSGLQVVKLTNGCEFPEGQKKDCVLFRECNAEKKKGITRILKGTNLDGYCLIKSNLFTTSKDSHAITSVCDKAKFSYFQLTLAGSKENKKCIFAWAK